MRFKTITWQERHFKKIAFFSVLITTALILVYYFCLNDKSDVFIPSTLYALFLYIIGAYKSNMSVKIDSLFLNRVDIYNNLKKVRDVLKPLVEKGTFEDTKLHISLFRVLSGRDTDPNTPKYRCFSEKGVKLNYKELKLEDSYLKLYEDFVAAIKKLHASTLDYIEANRVELKVKFCNFDLLIYYSPESWCKQTLKNFSSDNKKIIDFIYNEIENKNVSFQKLEKSHLAIINLYAKYKNEVDNHILLIERTYGNKLIDHLEYEKGVAADIDYFVSEIDNMKNEIIGYVENNDDKLDTCSYKMDCVLEDVNETNETMQELIDRIDSSDDIV